jgi:hypothetical protein
MAIYHLNVSLISRSQGRSATAAAAYRAGEVLHDVRTRETHDYRRKSHVDGAEIHLPEGAPTWMRERSTLWNSVELSERRKDSRLAREMDVALPVELPEGDKREVVRQFVREQILPLGMVADVAFHHLKGANPHAHVLMTTRQIEADGGWGLKVRAWDSWRAPELIQRWREAWARIVNAALSALGLRSRIDHRTLAAQGIDRAPSVHLGRWHSINRNRRRPAPVPWLLGRETPWAETPMSMRDRRSRHNAGLFAPGSTWQPGTPWSVMPRVARRHLAERLDAWLASNDEASLRQRARGGGVIDIEQWMARSKRAKRLQSRLVEVLAERDRLDAQRRAAQAFLNPTTFHGKASALVDRAAVVDVSIDRIERERDRWLEGLRVRLEARERKRVASQLQAAQALDRVDGWRAQLQELTAAELRERESLTLGRRPRPGG